MSELELKYGCNPNQKPSRIYMKDGSDLPVTVLSGKPGYINFLDALNSWQLVRELKEATGLPAAASFKHVSPAGAAVGKPLSDVEKSIYFVDDEGELSPIACAYIRARGADRMSSYGDWAALSDTCDARTALYLKHEVSDGVIAPAYTDEALEILRAKKGGKYNVVQIDPTYEPAAIETKDVFGVTFEQGHNFFKIDRDLISNVVTKNKEVPEDAQIDMIVSLITLKYTQSKLQENLILESPDEVVNRMFAFSKLRASESIYETAGGPMHGPGGESYYAAIWANDQAEYVNPFFPFGDNVERAHKSGVRYIAEPGGSIRDDNVIETADKYGIAMAFTGMRLFHH